MLLDSSLATPNASDFHHSLSPGARSQVASSTGGKSSEAVGKATIPETPKSSIQQHDYRITKRTKSRNKCRSASVSHQHEDDDNPRQQLAKSQLEEHRRLFWSYMFSIGIPGEACIKSPSTYRIQMKAAFLDKQFQRLYINQQQVNEILDDWLAPRGDAMAAAIDTLLLMQQALITRDTRYMAEGKRRHNAALRLLNIGLQNPNAADDDSLLGAIDILGACSMFSDIANGENHWIVHCRGLLGLLKTRGPHRVNSAFLKRLVMHFRNVALTYALQARKSFIFGQQNWLDWQGVSEHATPAPPGAKLQSLACEVPALLEETDRIVSTKGRWTPTLQETYASLIDLQSRLQDWLLQTYKDRSEMAPYRRVPIERFQPYRDQYGHIKYPFGAVLEYTDSIDTVRHGFYWTVLLAVREAIYDLAINRPVSLCITEDNQTFLREQVYASADSICETVPFVCASFSQPIGSSSSFPSYIGGGLSICCPLRLAHRWYQKQGNEAKAAWCQHLLADALHNLKEQGLSWLDTSDIPVNIDMPDG